MATEIRKHTSKFKKGEMYTPDSLNDVPSDLFHQHFNSDEFEIKFGEYEYGSAQCTKNIEITTAITIKT